MHLTKSFCPALSFLGFAVCGLMVFQLASIEKQQKPQPTFVSIRRPAQARKPRQQVYSAAQCSLSFDTGQLSWLARTCELQGVCFTHGIEDATVYASVREDLPPRLDVSLSPGSAIWAGTVGKRWAPVVSSASIPSDATWVRGVHLFYSSYHDENPGHFLPEELFGWWLMMHTHGHLDAMNSGQLTAWRFPNPQNWTCDKYAEQGDQGWIDRCAKITRNFSPLVLPQLPVSTVNVTASHFPWHLTHLQRRPEGSSLRARPICFERVLVGMGMLNDHCLDESLHGMIPGVIHRCNENRAGLIKEFTDHVLRHAGVRELPLRLPGFQHTCPHSHANHHVQVEARSRRVQSAKQAAAAAAAPGAPPSVQGGVPAAPGHADHLAAAPDSTATAAQAAEADAQAAQKMRAAQLEADEKRGWVNATITVALNSSANRGAKDQHLIEPTLRKLFPGIPIVAVDFAQLPVVEQLRIATRTAVFIAPCGGGNVMAQFTPRAASILLYCPGAPNRDFHLYNFLPQRAVHWMPAGPVDGAYTTDFAALERRVRSSLRHFVCFRAPEVHEAQ